MVLFLLNQFKIREAFGIAKALWNWVFQVAKVCPSAKTQLDKDWKSCEKDCFGGCALVKAVIFTNMKLIEMNPTGFQVPLVAHGRFIDSSIKEGIKKDAFQSHVRLLWKHMVFPILEDILFHQRDDLDKFRFECLFSEWNPEMKANK